MARRARLPVRRFESLAAVSAVLGVGALVPELSRHIFNPSLWVLLGGALTTLVAVSRVRTEKSFLRPEAYGLIVVCVFTVWPGLLIYAIPAVKAQRPVLNGLEIGELAALLTVSGPIVVCAGILVARAVSLTPTHGLQSDSGFRYPRVGRGGLTISRVVLVAILGYRARQLMTDGIGSYGAIRGFDQSFASQFETIAGLSLFVATGLSVAWSRTHPSRRLDRLSIALIGVISFITLALGSRSELVPVLSLFLLDFAWRNRGAPLARRVVLGGMFTLLLFSVLGQARAGDVGIARLRTTPRESLAAPVAAPYQVLTIAIDESPEVIPFYYGRTYLADITNLVPTLGFDISSQTRSGALEFREQYRTGTTNGLGLSPAAEAYMNFGVVGSLASWVFLGVALQVLYRRSLTKGSFAYICFLCYLPMALRADLLQTVKAPLYVFIGIHLIASITRPAALRNSVKLAG